MKLRLILLACLMVAACGEKPINPDNPTPGPGPKPGPTDPISVNISLSLDTKALDTSYEAGDQIGMYMVYGGSMKSSGNYVNNKKYTLKEGKWKGDDYAYWKDDTTSADFYCYHPYSAPSDALAYEFKVKEDQSDLYAYKASDFLWGKTTGVVPTENAVSISTSHIMSSMTVALVPGAGFTQEEFDAAKKSVTIGNVRTLSSINLSTGGVASKGEASSVKAYKDGNIYKAVIVPQSVAADADMLIVTVDGVTYTSREEFTFKPKTRHQFTVTVDKKAASLDITVEDWIYDDQDHTSTVN